MNDNAAYLIIIMHMHAEEKEHNDLTQP